MRYAVCPTVLICGLLSAVAHADPSVSFRKDIAPILQDSCLACHGSKRAEGGYRVDTYDELFKPGDSGEMPIAESPMDPGELIRRIASEDEFERMPTESDALTSEQIAVFKKWVTDGAKFDGEDSSQSLALVIPPPTYATPPEHYSHALPVAALAFSPDGKQIVSSGYHELLVWNAEDGNLERRISNVGQQVFSLCFSSDANNLAVACGEPGRSGEVRLLDFRTGKVRGVVSRSSDVILDVEYRPGTAELAIASTDGLIRVVNSETLKEIHSIAGHADWVTSVTWSDDGTLLASSSRDKSAKVYNAATGDLVASYLGHKDFVRSVSILPSNKQAISVGADKKLHRWSIGDNKRVAEVALGSDGNAIIRDGQQLLIPCADSRILSIDVKTNKITKVYKGHTDWVLSVAPQHSGASDSTIRIFASGAFNGEINLWNAANESIVRGWIAKP